MSIVFISCGLLPTLDLDSTSRSESEQSGADNFRESAKHPVVTRRVRMERAFFSVLGLLDPARLQARWNEGRDNRILQEALLRLSETSPHLLSDIGMEQVTEDVSEQDASPRPVVSQQPIAAVRAPWKLGFAGNPSGLAPHPAE